MHKTLNLLFGFLLLLHIVEVILDEVSDNSILKDSTSKENSKGDGTKIPQHFHKEENNSEATHEHDPASTLFNLLVNSFDDSKEKNSLNASSEKSEPDVVVIVHEELLPASIQKPDISVPEVEMEKLKTAAKNAGLPNSKADRVVRAAEEMNMQYNDIVELRKMFNNPATSAEYADKMRRALENSVVDQHLKKNAHPVVVSDNEIYPEKKPAESTQTDKANPQTDATAGSANPFDRNFDPKKFPFPALLPFLPRITKMLEVFNLPPGIFGPKSTEKSPALDLWKAASSKIGNNDAYRLIVICYNLKLKNEELNDLTKTFSDSKMTKEKGLQILTAYEARLKQISKADLSIPNLDPVTLQTLKTFSKIAGLNETASHRLVRAVMDAELTSEHVANFSKAIQDHAPGSNDLEKLTSLLEENNSKKNPENHGSNENEWPDQPVGADWIFSASEGKDESEDAKTKSTREINEAGSHGQGSRAPRNSLDSQLFTAKRFCGFCPIVQPNRLSNTSPGQYPWMAAVLSSNDEFLCSGVLISESIVICPASCILRYNSATRNQLPVKVLFSWSMFEAHETHSFLPLSSYVSSAVFHPSVTDTPTQDISDSIGNLALLRLTKNVDFDLYPHINPICVIGESLEQYAGTNNCVVLGYPHAPTMNNVEVENWRPRSYLWSSSVMVVKRTNCGGPGAHTCITGFACGANEGSPVICLANSQRYYLWGIVKRDTICDSSTSITIPVVNVLHFYPFVSQYLFTINPNTDAGFSSLGLYDQTNTRPSTNVNSQRMPVSSSSSNPQSNAINNEDW